MREVYYYDHSDDFGLSGFAGTLCARTGLRADEPVVLALAAAEAEDHQLGRDVRLLLDSVLPGEVLHTVWLAAVRRIFDPAQEPAGEGSDLRAWLRRLAEVCPPGAPDRDPYEVESLGGVRPMVTEEELRTLVAAEIGAAGAGLGHRVAVPGIDAALLRVVREADADLGFRLFLRALKAYSVPVGAEQYGRLLGIGELLAYPPAVVHDGLEMRWPPLDPGRRDFAEGRFGLPFLAAVFHRTDWQYQGTVQENLHAVAGADGPGDTPGSHAAVLLEDVQRLLDSTLTDEALTTLWRTAASRLYAGGEPGSEPGATFDADGRTWLKRVADACRKRLTEADPAYAPYLSPARTDLAAAVLREVREAVHAEVPEVRAVAQVLADVTTATDPDLAFRLLVQVLSTYDVPVAEDRRPRLQALAEYLGFSPDHLEDRLRSTTP
ncbi:hypothetical protein [Streptomyces sp. NPDC054952]